MKRFEVTTASKLNVGDVFYKLKDRAKTPYEIVNGHPKVTQYQTYTVHARKLGTRHGLPMKSNTEVVFLRPLNTI